MTYTITAEGCGSFPASAADRLLDAGQRAGFGFPHACRNGNCERCLATLVSGQVRYPDGLDERLRERHGETALLCCQAQPASDVHFRMPGLTAPGELPLVEKTCQKLELTPLNRDVSLLRLRLPAGRGIDWYAGQYLGLRLDDRWLSFSIANAPAAGRRELEVHFRHLAHHASAQQHLAWLSQHDLIRVRLPLGHCHLPALPQRPLWFICGSTGFAPAQAMLQYLADHAYQGSVRLFWGNREQADIYLPDAPARLAQRLPGLEVELVLSDQQVAGYRQGNVHEIALEYLSDPAAPLVFISGSPAMVDAVHGALRRAGVSEAQLLSDMLPAPEKRPSL